MYIQKIHKKKIIGKNELKIKDSILITFQFLNDFPEEEDNLKKYLINAIDLYNYN